MANYIIRLKLKSKDEPEHLHFTAIEEAVNLFNACIHDQYDDISSVILSDDGEILKYAMLYDGMWDVISLYDNVILTDRADDKVYSIVKINLSTGKVTIKDLNIHTRSAAFAVFPDDVVTTKRDDSKNFHLVTNIKRKYPYPLQG